MARPNTQAAAGIPSTFTTRAMPPVRNPVYRYNYNDAFKVTPQPMHSLERPRQPPIKPYDQRLTVTGDTSRATGLSPIVPMAYQTPVNVWELYPA